MIEEASNTNRTFSCLDLHRACSCDSCPQQHHKHGNYESISNEEGKQLVIAGTMTELGRSAEAGCKTCAILYGGLNLPEIRQVWSSSVRQAMKIETRELLDFEEGQTKIEIMWDVGFTVERLVVRTLPRLNGPTYRRHFNFGSLPSVMLSTDCKVFPVLETFPVKDTRSKDSYAHLKRWIDICDRTHTCTSKSLPLLPARVLKVSGDKIVLYLRPDGEKARYTTLSHTWGSQTSFTLTVDTEEKKGTFNSFVKGIPWATIPRTFQDAIIVSRELDIEYLWIDSLCIIQNSRQDWEEQSREMSSIYGRSWLNIAATDSKDSRGGCFRVGNEDQMRPLRRIPQNPNIVVMDQPVNTHKDFGINYRTDLSSPPLLQRGWVFQELMLSPRVVYYTQDELRWECNTMTDCQCGGIIVLARFKPHYYESVRGEKHHLPFVWMKVIERYSWLKFTYPEKDRMIALAGVAKELHSQGTVGKYLAGHWMQDLSSQLYWSVIEDCRRPTRYFAPSWSWLSVLGTIEHSKIEFHRQKRPQIDVCITEAKCLPSGVEGFERVTSGFIVITGKILCVDVEVTSAPQQERPRFRLWHQNSTLEYSDFRPDYILSPAEACQIKEVSVLFWGRVWFGKGDTEFHHIFMVLLRSTDNSDAFVRLGLISLPERPDDPGTSLIRAFAEMCELRTDIVVI